MNRTFTALLVLFALTAPAAAAKDPFASFIANVATNPKAAAASLKGCDCLLAPNGEARTPCMLTLADFGGAQSLKVTRHKDSSVKQSVLEYLDADVQALVDGKVIATYRVLAITGGNPDMGFQALAIHVAKMMGDQEAAAKAKAKQLPAAPAIKEQIMPAPKGMDDENRGDRSSGIESIKSRAKDNLNKETLAQLAADGGLFGSAPGQRYAGKSARESIKKWKLEFAQKGGMTCDGSAMIAYCAIDVVATMADKSTLTYVALVVGVAREPPMGGGRSWSTELISLAVPQ